MLFVAIDCWQSQVKLNDGISTDSAMPLLQLNVRRVFSAMQLETVNTKLITEPLVSESPTTTRR